ncbi:MAG TPA: hypothetical protein GXZ56_03030 [Bacteroidales bacterium]|jgi:hypothetical protein|nr:hypothetical protein [Bacteroidales bacterium]
MTRLLQHISYLSFIIAFMMMWGCIGEEFELHDDLPVPEGTKAIELCLTIRNSTEDQAATRGVSTEPGDHDKGSYDAATLNENKIDKIELFLFDATTKNLIKSFGNTTVQRLTPNADPTQADSYKVRVVVPQSEVNNLEGKSVHIVGVINAKADVVTGVTKLAELELKVQDNLNELAQTTAQTNFLMDGSLSPVTINWGANDRFMVTQTLGLRRALAKIRLRITEVNVKDYSNGIETPYEIVHIDNDETNPQDISVRLLHYTEKSFVIAGSTPYAPTAWKDTDYRAMTWKAMVGKTNSNPDHPDQFLMHFPFYSYENNWTGDWLKESYLTVRIKLRPKFLEDGTTPNTDDPGVYYYYRFPVNYRMPMDGMGAEKINRLERNHLYDIVTTIAELGSLDEDTPMEVTSHIAIEPWITGDVIDGTMDEAHYLVVKELTPIMANDATREIDYVSSLPVNITINEAYYNYFDMRGDFFKVVFTFDGTNGIKRTYKNNVLQSTETVSPAFDGSTVEVAPEGTHLKDGKLIVTHTIPNNYTPFYIKFTVSQQGGGLTQEVFVTQYPPIYITGRESIGFRPTEGDIAAARPYADFRHHSTLGIMATYQGESTQSAQRNDVFNRVTSKVPTDAFLIGNPVDANGLTKSDAASNNMVSPEFIIATQHGMSFAVPQKDGGATQYLNPTYASGYGPYAVPSLYPDNVPYRGNSPGGSTHYYRSYTHAQNRCSNYFEGEYGIDGDYVEHYKTPGSNYWQTRTVRKTFKYQGRWRIPTLAEAKLIDQIQDDPNTLTKGLMYGTNYWTAKDGTAYNFRDNVEFTSNSSYVRCIFDTAHLDDK